MEGKRVRLADVAKMAGVSTATVSLVLNDHPRISDATKERVLRICKETGYSMDPVARAFARKRSGAADSSYLGTLAILEGREPMERRKQIPPWDYWIQQLDQACLSAGYKPEHFAVEPDEKKQRALNRVLQARGIQGLIVFGHSQEIRQWNLDWKRFSVVGFASSLHEHFAHNIMCSSYQDMYDAMTRLYDSGYTRPGYFMTGSRDYWEAGFSMALEHRDQRQLPKLILNGNLYQDSVREKFLSWFKQCRPDVIIGNSGEKLLQVFEAAGFHVPEDVGYFCLDIWPAKTNLSGLIQLKDVAYRTAVDLLHGMLIRHEFGPPVDPFCIQIPSRWNDGKTLR